MLFFFARSMTRDVTSRSWLTVPAADSRLAQRIVCTLSMTSARGLCSAIARFDALELCVGEKEKMIVVGSSETTRARRSLAGALFAGDVEALELPRRERRERLEEQRGFPDAGIAADERHAAKDNAAAEDTIELADARRHARELVDRDVAEWNRLGHRRGAFGFVADDLFGDGVPRAALGAAPDPFREARAAGLAHVFRRDFRHAPYRPCTKNVSKIR